MVLAGFAKMKREGYRLTISEGLDSRRGWPRRWARKARHVQVTGEFNRRENILAVVSRVYIEWPI